MSDLLVKLPLVVAPAGTWKQATLVHMLVQQLQLTQFYFGR